MVNFRTHGCDVTIDKLLHLQMINVQMVIQ